MTVEAELPLFVQAGAATKPAPSVLGAGPARADTLLPLFVEGMPSEAVPEMPCTSLLCQIDLATDLVFLTLYVMLCVAVMLGLLKLIALLRMAAWEIFYLLEDACVSAMTARAVSRGRSPAGSDRPATGS